MPSISDRNCATTVASMSDEMPDPRMRNSESISSKKITTGTSSSAFSRAFLKTSRILLLRLADVLVQKLRALHVQEVGVVALPARSSMRSARLFATAFAIIVLPQPGGP